MNRFKTLLRSKTVWGVIGGAIVHVASQPTIRLPQILEGVFMVVTGVGVRDAIAKAGR